MIRITGIGIAYQPELGTHPVFHVTYEQNGAYRWLHVKADDAIGANQAASKLLGITFKMLGV